MKKSYLILGVLVLIGISFFIYKLATFDLFDNKLKYLAERSIQGKNYKIYVYSYPSSATIQGSIQIHIKYLNGEEKLLKNYDKYNKLVFLVIHGDSILETGITDSVIYNSKVDTFKLRLP